MKFKSVFSSAIQLFLYFVIGIGCAYFVSTYFQAKDTVEYNVLADPRTEARE